MEEKKKMEPEVKKENQVVVFDKTIADQVMNRVMELEKHKRVTIPESYSVENALQSSYLILQTVEDKEHRPALVIATKESIANALFDMVVQGLNPQKKQCYFIVRGNKLCLDRSYFGDQAVVKRVVPGITDIFANIIYKDDIVVIEQNPQGRMTIKTHETKFENRDKGITGAYCVIIKDDLPYFEIMTWAEIQVSWSKRSNAGAVQKEFQQEMAKRTVIRRAVKNFINASDDSNLEIADSYNRTTADEFENTGEVVESVKKEVTEQTGKVIPPVQSNPGPEQLDAERMAAMEAMGANAPLPGQETLFETQQQQPAQTAQRKPSFN
jgi:recombination protein RecT